ncbi:SigE family RNA polymerase sigma factor [Streptomyces alkaliterrae]|uniref:SigE family RNA polymerase sigma factor n=1 Tax=Streptomyces alkaliterrae TaxID=2213162 RepID=A0A5P0YYT2_9ACTN|nr:SigE family RNA polymerase sigma factor [Streptomyces alkaliterrae]MBB1254278.1 SigE family RNA polymerase sigma factor [Streptomyces alkaliterrae]MBB1261482.1 SigE family RNA polymerase sigma factor [Streptomyces alkaliterrae]MQS04712.1 SigE family RNA polymerase sigma factor [Streptomyces alkaliterrae]
MTAATGGADVLDFEEYVRTRQDALLRSARRLVSDPIDAQDLLQTALARTCGKWDRIADKSLADAYLRRVMINTRTEWWRARRLEEVPTDVLPDVVGVDDGIERYADREMLVELLGLLAPKQRSVVILRHWEQMSTEETAAALGMSPGTVKSTLHRALARLRSELIGREREWQQREPGEVAQVVPVPRARRAPEPGVPVGGQCAA